MIDNRMAAKDYDHLFKLLIIGALRARQSAGCTVVFRRLRGGEELSAGPLC